jgi:hypothetical protein
MNNLPLKDRSFEIIDGVMCVFKKALSEAGLSVSYFENLNSQGSDKTMLHPKNKKMLLAKFELLSEQHQQKIKARYGNPYDFVAREPILQLINRNNAAEQFFLSHTLDNGNKLPIKRVKQYSRAADWLDLLKHIDDNRNKPIKDIGIKVEVFYDHIDALMQHEKLNGMSESYEGNCQLPAKFPTSYRKLRPKLQEYITTGPSSLIDKAFGNQAAAKVQNEECETYLLALISDPRQFDDVMICMMYCEWAKGKGYPMITAPTVGVWRRKHEAIIITGREGSSAYNERYIRQVKGMRPTAPLFLVEHDDNNLDFLFSDDKGNVYNRYVSIVVTDSHCDYVLGKSYAPITSDMGDTMQLMIRHAYLDAMYNIRRLTGGWYLPFELKADKYALKSLLPFYTKIGNFVTPSHGNKHRGYIEQFFRSNTWKRSQKLISEGNYNGNNITARNTGVNKEWLDANKNFRPQIGDAAEAQIENFFSLLRTLPDFTRENMNAKSKEQQWLEAFNALPIEKKRPITDEQFLLIFGISPKNRQITINNRGVEPQINGERYSYDLPETWMYNKLIGEKVSVVYDPFDMSRVLVTNYDSIRFVAQSAVLTPRALQDHMTGSRTYLNAILTEKANQVNEVSRSADTRKHITIPGYYNAEAVMQSSSAKKQVKNNAEQKVIEQQFSNEYEQFLDSNNDFNQFFTQP